MFLPPFENRKGWGTLTCGNFRISKGGPPVLPAGANAEYYVEDSLGSSRVVTTNTGTVCYDADFTPFGGEKAYTNTCSQNYKFEGKERDTETQNDDFGAREYTWRFGRWLSSDWSSTPVAVPYANLLNPQTLNLYAMVEDDPESFADLDGHGEQTGAQPTPNAPQPDCGAGGTQGQCTTNQTTASDKAAEQVKEQTQLSVADVSKIIQTAESSKADPVTTALNIFKGMGTNASVSGDTLRSALSSNNIKPEGDNAKLINNIDSITKTGDNVTINNHAGLTAGHVSEQKTVSFSVGTINGHSAITNIQGIKGGLGFIKTSVHSVEVLSTSGKRATIRANVTGLPEKLTTVTIGGP